MTEGAQMKIRKYLSQLDRSDARNKQIMEICFSCANTELVNCVEMFGPNFDAKQVVDQTLYNLEESMNS